MLEVGTGIADITAFKKGIGMMGYGMPFNKVKDVATLLSARAFVIKDVSSNKKIVVVNAEICFITLSIKNGVIKKLQEKYPHYNYTDNNVLLTAQHTHSGPGGYSFYAFYNLTIPGFVADVYNTIVDGIVDAIAQAELKVQPANIYMGAGIFEPHLEVAFNRSLKAYNANPEVTKIDGDKTHLAVDREMTLLRMDGLAGEKIGTINWFGVHTTNISNDNTKICYDNKGYAASYFEEDIHSNSNQKNFIATFAQSPAGDISPNFIWDKKKKWTRGKYEDDFESARYNGKIQYKKAKEIYEAANKNAPLKNEIDSVLMYADFSSIKPDLEFTNGQSVQTSAACLGVSFAEGTAEGPGIPLFSGNVIRVITSGIKYYELLKANFTTKEKRIRIHLKYKSQGKKDIFFETGNRKILGIERMNRIPIPGWLDKTVGSLKKQYANGSLKKPWTPQILPLQIVIVGELAIVAFPGEITTVAGWRLRKTILDILKKRGIEKVIISPYANAYCGYVTTYEEYQCQCYEGGHTVFGEWSLAAFQTKFKELALQLLKNSELRTIDNSIIPLEFTPEELANRSYVDKQKNS